MKQVAKDLINGDEISYPDYEEVKRRSLVYFRGIKSVYINKKKKIATLVLWTACY